MACSDTDSSNAPLRYTLKRLVPMFQLPAAAIVKRLGSLLSELLFTDAYNPLIH